MPSTYIILDTASCNSEKNTYVVDNIVTTRNVKSLSWSLRTDAISLHKTLNNVSGIRMLPCTILPNTTTAYSSSNSNMYTICINELAAQCYYANSGRYHFMAMYDNNNLIPREYDKGYFMFDPPINNIDSISIVIKKNGTITYTPFPYTCIRTATVISPTQIRITLGDELKIGDVVRINKVTPLNSNANVLYNTEYTIMADTILGQGIINAAMNVNSIIEIENISARMVFAFEVIHN